MRIPIVLLFLFSSLNLFSQFDHINVFKSQEGEELFESLNETYKPAFVLGFGPARDVMFAEIDSKNNVLTCVYTGHAITLDPNEDPTVSAYMDGSPDGINTEHTWPQSKGAESGEAKSDMHHLYPTRSVVNSARGNDPFKEIPDGETDNWFYLNESSNTIPSSNINLYSEDVNLGFEPREDHKGNVARAMFYFYTMYRDEAVAASPDFFELQREVLCDWHWQDPVDEVEWERNQKIAVHQDGKVNPFILDCSLAARMYCDQIDAACALVDNENIEVSSPKVFPNPSKGECTIDWESKRYKVLLTNSTGQVLSLGEGKDKTIVELPKTSGIYFLTISTDQENRFTIKLVNQ